MGCRICLGLKIYSGIRATSIWLIADSDCVDSYKDETINMGSTPILGLIVSPLPKIRLHPDPCDLICKYWVYRCNLLRWSHIRLLVVQLLSCVWLWNPMDCSMPSNKRKPPKTFLAFQTASSFPNSETLPSSLEPGWRLFGLLGSSYCFSVLPGLPHRSESTELLLPPEFGVLLQWTLWKSKLPGRNYLNSLAWFLPL